jgi:hypothetical protein
MTYDDWRESYSAHPMYNEAMAEAAWRAATAAERERCAGLCEGAADVVAATSKGVTAQKARETALSCARVIRLP